MGCSAGHTGVTQVYNGTLKNTLIRFMYPNPSHQVDTKKSFLSHWGGRKTLNVPSQNVLNECFSLPTTHLLAQILLALTPHLESQSWSGHHLQPLWIQVAALPIGQENLLPSQVLDQTATALVAHAGSTCCSYRTHSVWAGS